MKTDTSRSELIDELLGDVATSDFREQTLANTLASVRQRRFAKQRRRVALAALLPILLLGFWFVYVAPHRLGLTQQSALTQVPDQPQPNVIAGTSIRVITDEELFAMFPNRPVGMIHRGQNAELVFLDELTNDQ